MSPINQDDVLQILKLIDESHIEELRLEMGDLKLIVKKHTAQGVVQEYETPMPAPSEATALSEERPVSPEEEGLTPIKSPMLGTFYLAPKPGAPPFVEVGQVVSEDDTVCIIEVMKLFNSIKAGVRGRIAKVCAENAQMVEFQQTLFLVEENLEKRTSKKRAAK